MSMQIRDESVYIPCVHCGKAVPLDDVQRWDRDGKHCVCLVCSRAGKG